MKEQLNDIKSFLNEFKNRKGGYVFTAIILSKILGFCLTAFVTNTVSKHEFGLITYAYNIISFVAPFAGFGLFQSLGRFGPIQKSQLKKRQLFKYIMNKGVIASIILIALVVLFSGLLSASLPDSQNYLIIISSLILSLFIFEVIKIYFRIYNINKLFAYLEIFNSITLLILGIGLTFSFGGTGYLIALIFSPLIVSIYIIIKYGLLKKIDKNNFSKPYKKSLWSYGFYTSIGGLSSKLIFSIDILTIGYLMHDPIKVALYKTASIIPFALLFIPRGVMQTDLVKLTQNYRNKIYLKKYISNYMKLFFIISAVTFVTLYFSAEYIISIFGNKYSDGANLIPVFAFGLIGAFIFKTPFGSILFCIGWSKTNTVISVVVLVFDVILNYFLIDKFGIIGAAYSTSFLLWVAGLASYIAVNKYLKTLD